MVTFQHECAYHFQFGTKMHISKDCYKNKPCYEKIVFAEIQMDTSIWIFVYFQIRPRISIRGCVRSIGRLVGPFVRLLVGPSVRSSVGNAVFNVAIEAKIKD